MTMQDERSESQRSAAHHAEVDMRRRVSATPVEVAGLRHAVLASAEAHAIPKALRNDVALAVSEACANVVMHAYPDARTPGSLTVETYHEEREFIVVVTDEGVGFAPRTDSPGLGLGLALIGQLTRRLEITQNTPVGARLTMAFAVA
jgi:anti-sigma regulatory factor (Ser/Thr protein kinase)